MSIRFKNQIALITGGGGAIGRAIARGFAAEGARVFVVGRRDSPLTEVVSEIEKSGGQCDAITADIGSSGDVARIVDKLKECCDGFDILVNAAGVMKVNLVHETSEQDFDDMFHTNVRGLWLLSKSCVPLMRGRPNANIINISSSLAMRTDAAIGIYEASKAAVNTLTKVMAKELASHRIRVNAIAPGPIDTELYKGSIYGDDLEDRSGKKGRANVPFGRMGTPEEVARLALFLASPESDFINGSINRIDGAIGL